MHIYEKLIVLFDNNHKEKFSILIDLLLSKERLKFLNSTNIKG